MRRHAHFDNKGGKRSFAAAKACEGPLCGDCVEKLGVPLSKADFAEHLPAKRTCGEQGFPIVQFQERNSEFST